MIIIITSHHITAVDNTGVIHIYHMSAITRIVAQTLQVERCLVCLNEDLNPNHALLADRENVRYEIQYSSLHDILNDDDLDSAKSSSNNQSLVINRLTKQLMIQLL